MISSMVEKLKKVKEAEERARQVRDYYRHMAEETLAEAREEAVAIKNREEARAREEGEQEMNEIIELGGKEAEELRVEYMYDRMRLLAEVVERRKDAVAFLVEKLEKGD